MDLEFAAELGRRAGAAIDNAMLHQAVAASEERYRVLSETLPQLVWSCHADGYCDYLSSQWVEYTGVPMQEHLGWNWPQALHPEDRDVTFNAWRRASANATDYNIEYRLRRHDGCYRWFKARGVALRDEHKRVTRWFGTSTDIDDQKRAQQAETESRERLSAALNASNTGTFRWNISTGELEWDENLDRLFGLPAGQTARLLENFIGMVHPDDQQGVVERSGGAPPKPRNCSTSSMPRRMTSRPFCARCLSSRSCLDASLNQEPTRSRPNV